MIVIRGARVGLGGPVADVVVLGGRVVAVGGGVDPDGADPGGADVIEATGGTVLPGMVDAHVHMEQWAHSANRVDVGAATGPDGVVAILRDAVAGGRAPAEGWLFGGGYVDGLWALPAHRDVLDAAFGARPVAAYSMDLHAVWLNGAALAAVGERDHPTGLLREDAGFATMRLLAAAVPRDVSDEWVMAATYAAAARGVTGIVDYENADNALDWQRRSAAHGPMGVRVHAGVWRPWLDRIEAEGQATGDVVEGSHGIVHVGPFKVISDGSLNTRTASCHDPYPSATNTDEAYGLQLVIPDDLIALVRRAHAAGLVPAVHAIGDRANGHALDVFEAVGCGGRIEHAQLVADADLPRFARLGVVASIQPQHATADRDVAERHWPGRTGRAFPYGALHRAGARLLLGSDAPVGPLDPWVAIAAAVTRTDDDRPPWHPEQRLPLDVAVAAACDGRTTIAVGDVADLVVVGADVARTAPRDLPDVPIAATMVAGRLTHRATDPV